MGRSCVPELCIYADRAARLPDDAEIAFVNGLVRDRCGRLELPSSPEPTPSDVTYRVRVDSDTPISEVRLQCAGGRSSESLSPSDQVARLSARPGSCTLVLVGPVELTTQVRVPSTDASVTCRIRGGRLDCR